MNNELTKSLEPCPNCGVNPYLHCYNGYIWVCHNCGELAFGDTPEEAAEL